MSPHRFFLDEPVPQGKSTVSLPQELSRQITRVLRMRNGDRIVIFDGSGLEWPATIESTGKDSVSVEIGHGVDPLSEPKLAVTVCQALVPSDRMDYVIQKCTELGAKRIIPILTERVQAKDAAPSGKRIERWQRIAREAAELAGRTRIPEVTAQKSLDEVLGMMLPEGPVLMLWEEEHGKPLRVAVRESLSNNPGHVGLLIGPVGGLSEAEAIAARDAGAVVVGAGVRILRAETAPVVALAALMYEAGELGG
ncbi:MAG: 16S rRNA (uracil(1498)-N(3))-methyltransferase [Chloroflexi bacterium]|nr:16S rRNA (uracil(1498)-N(3))-methyltransferase [Chloroflexota bacterium]